MLKLLYQILYNECSTTKESLYIYKAYVTDVYDGDTITRIIDEGHRNAENENTFIWY